MKIQATKVYTDFLDALNDKDLRRAQQFVDPKAYRENCVAFTKGFVNWNEATESLQTVWQGIPDLHVSIHAIHGDDTTAIAHGIVTGTASGRLYGAPATNKNYNASFFDLIKIKNGLIVYRVQQSDVLGQMRQLYGKGLGLVGVGGLLFKQLPVYPDFKL